MGLIIDQKVNSNCRLGIWEIQESYNELFSKLDLHQEDITILENFKSHRRKLEWMSVRVLLNTLTKKNNAIVYNGNRKPFLADNSYHISISHSYHYAALLISPQSNVGIDIEKIQPKITHIAEKFLTEAELQHIDPEKKTYHLYLHWCAKEALYKMFDKKDINFKKNLIIEPFIPEDEGSLTGKVRTQKIYEKIRLNYFHINNNYSIVWGYKN
ncbi:MAG: 4'-phosphopantetheinyl transferase superfamily protein [Bacteroidota bacterium]